MKKPRKELGEDDIVIVCPFCNDEVLHDYKGEDGFDDFNYEFCEHVIFANSWATELWSEDGTMVETGDERLDEQLREKAANSWLPDFTGMGKQVCRFLRKLPEAANWDLRSAGRYIERGMGPRGGGPTYTIVFRRIKGKSAGARRDRKRDVRK